MKYVSSLPFLYKRDNNNRIRVWEIQFGWDNDDVAGVRTISGLQEGQLTTSEWNLKEAKNIGKKNATTAKTQAEFEAKSTWERRLEKEYFQDVKDIDSYDKFKPMLAEDYKKHPVSEGYTQPKLDGIRCIANKDGLWTRAGKEITSCPHIWEALKSYFETWPTAIFDGELYNHDLKADFNKITSLVRKLKSTEEDFENAANLVQYHIYDITWKNGVTMNFKGRYEMLKTIENNDFYAPDIVNYYHGVNQYLKIVETTWCANQEELDAKYSEYTENGYEGQMVRKDAIYENKRTKSLLKRKEFITEEFEVVNMLEGLGNWSGYTKRFTLKTDKGQEFGSGIRGTQKQLKELWESKKTPNWVTCRFFNLTPDGIPRFPVVIDYGYGERQD